MGFKAMKRNMTEAIRIEEKEKKWGENKGHSYIQDSF